MTQWATFTVITGVVLTILLVLSYLTQQAFAEPSELYEESQGRERERKRERRTRGAGSEPSNAAQSTPQQHSDPTNSSDTERRSSLESGGPQNSPEREGNSPARGQAQSSTPHAGEMGQSDALGNSDDMSHDPPEADSQSSTPPSNDQSALSATDARAPAHRRNDPRQLSSGMLLANVAFSQGLLAAIILGAALYTAIPPEALGVQFDRGYLVTGILVGTGAGLILYAANELGAGLAVRLGIDHDESLREMLAPEDARGWFLLLVFVLPIIAFFEELLFRAALIGALSAGFDVPIWVLAVGSSLAFAIGHGMQGTVGIIVTGALGLVLAALFIVTQSLLVVVVAHYLINALEFIVHEGLGLEWAHSSTETITES